MKTSNDLQFLARMLSATRRGDQITRAEAVRLDDIATNGRSTGKLPEPAIDAGGIRPELMATATRAGQI